MKTNERAITTNPQHHKTGLVPLSLAFQKSLLTVLLTALVFHASSMELKSVNKDRLIFSRIIRLYGIGWSMAIDLRNEGRELKSFNNCPAEPVPTQVPCVIQYHIPEYHGMAWYWHAFKASENLTSGGRYPVRVQLVDPELKNGYDEHINVTIPGKNQNTEPPFTQLVFARDVVINGPTGYYRFLVDFEKNAAATGGDVDFFVDDNTDIQKVPVVERLMRNILNYAGKGISEPLVDLPDGFNEQLATWIANK